MAEHPQLAAYQVAVEAGAFAESSTAGAAGGAGPARPGARARRGAAGPPADGADDPSLGNVSARRGGDGMAAATFEAVDQPVPGLPGAHALPDLGQGPAGDR